MRPITYLKMIKRNYREGGEEGRGEEEEKEGEGEGNIKSVANVQNVLFEIDIVEDLKWSTINNYIWFNLLD